MSEEASALYCEWAHYFQLKAVCWHWIWVKTRDFQKHDQEPGDLLALACEQRSWVYLKLQDVKLHRV
jgi:hypothetical protein